MPYEVIERAGRQSSEDNVIYRCYLQKDAEQYAERCRNVWPHLQFDVFQTDEPDREGA